MSTRITAISMKGEVQETGAGASVLTILASGNSEVLRHRKGEIDTSSLIQRQLSMRATLTRTSSETFQALAEMSVEEVSHRFETMGSGYVNTVVWPDRTVFVWLSRCQAAPEMRLSNPLYMTTWLTVNRESHECEITAMLFGLSNNSETEKRSCAHFLD